MLNVPVPEVVLDRPRIVALIRQLEPAGVPEHVGMDREAELPCVRSTWSQRSATSSLTLSPCR